MLRFAPAAPVAAVLRIAEDDVVRIAVGAGRAFSASLAASFVLDDKGKGDFGRDCVPLALPAERNGDAVRDTTGGVPLREGGLLGRLIVGLSQEEKKSSAGSLAGVDVPSAGVETGAKFSIVSSG